MNMATMQMYCPSLKENVMATITEGKQVASKGGSLRNIIYGVFEGRKCLPKTVKAEVFAQHGFGAESFCADCKSAEGHGCGCGTKNAEYEDCEVCYATVDKGTLNDVQAGRICNECHRMNKYTGGTRTIKTPYNAETLNAENRCSICSGTGHNSKNCPSPTMSICGKCGGSDFISESYYDGQIYCQKCEVFIPNNELKTVKNPKWKEMFGAESFCADCKSAEGHGCGCGTKNAEFLYYYVLNEKGESPADFNTLEEAQAYVANSNEPLEIYERRNRDDEAYKMDKKMNAESFEAEKRDGRDMNLDEIEETYGEGRLCLLCFDGVMERGEMGFGRDATGTIYTCSNCGAREGMGLNAETFEAGSGLGKNQRNLMQRIIQDYQRHNSQYAILRVKTSKYCDGYTPRMIDSLYRNNMIKYLDNEGNPDIGFKEKSLNPYQLSDCPTILVKPTNKALQMNAETFESEWVVEAVQQNLNDKDFVNDAYKVLIGGDAKTFEEKSMAIADTMSQNANNDDFTSFVESELFNTESFEAYDESITERQEYKIASLGGKIDSSMDRSDASDYIKELMGKKSGTWKEAEYSPSSFDISWEDAQGVSSPSLPPEGIHFAEGADVSDYKLNGEGCEYCAEERELNAEGFCSECSRHAEEFASRSYEDAFFTETVSEMAAEKVSRNGKLALSLTALGIGVAMALGSDKITSLLDGLNRK